MMAIFGVTPLAVRSRRRRRQTATADGRGKRNHITTILSPPCPVNNVFPLCRRPRAARVKNLNVNNNNSNNIFRGLALATGVYVFHPGSWPRWSRPSITPAVSISIPGSTRTIDADAITIIPDLLPNGVTSSSDIGDVSFHCCR